MEIQKSNTKDIERKPLPPFLRAYNGTKTGDLRPLIQTEYQKLVRKNQTGRLQNARLFKTARLTTDDCQLARLSSVASSMQFSNHILCNCHNETVCIKPF